MAAEAAGAVREAPRGGFGRDRRVLSAANPLARAGGLPARPVHRRVNGPGLDAGCRSADPARTPARPAAFERAEGHGPRTSIACRLRRTPGGSAGVARAG